MERSISNVINDFRKTSIYKEMIPTKFNCGFPIIQIENRSLCVVLPFYRFQLSHELDKSTVYPIRYCVTILWDTAKPIRFEDLSSNKAFKRVQFEKPIGYFRHDEIKHLNKAQYYETKDHLYRMYDQLIEYLIDGEEYSKESEESFKQLLNMMIEPCLIPFYKVLNRKFADKFLR